MKQRSAPPPPPLLTRPTPANLALFNSTCSHRTATTFHPPSSRSPHPNPATEAILLVQRIRSSGANLLTSLADQQRAAHELAQLPGINEGAAKEAASYLKSLENSAGFLWRIGGLLITVFFTLIAFFGTTEFLPQDKRIWANIFLAVALAVFNFVLHHYLTNHQQLFNLASQALTSAAEHLKSGQPHIYPAPSQFTPEQLMARSSQAAKLVENGEKALARTVFISLTLGSIVFLGYIPSISAGTKTQAGQLVYQIDLNHCIPDAKLPGILNCTSIKPNPPKSKQEGGAPP